MRKPSGQSTRCRTRRAASSGCTATMRQPIGAAGQQAGFTMQQTLGSLPRGGTKRITWEQPVGSADVYEVAVIITRVRFADGKVWTAPEEELLDTF